MYACMHVCVRYSYQHMFIYTYMWYGCMKPTDQQLRGSGCPWPTPFLRRRKFVIILPITPLLKSKACVPPYKSSGNENPYYAKPHRGWRPPRHPCNRKRTR